MTRLQAEILPYGDAAFLVQYPIQHYDETVMNHITHLARSLSGQGDWEDVVTGYNSVLASYDPDILTSDTAFRRIWTALSNGIAPTLTGSRLEIPVCYGGEFGPDLKALAKAKGLSEKAVIALHSEQTYRVCMMGFIPGFAFLSETPDAIHHPRHATPRLNVAAGSIGIAGWQTGIYGLESPGGWQIIGRTPDRMFDALRKNPFLLAAGDRVKFVPIDPAAFGTRS